jgi:hypothetical protein
VQAQLAKHLAGIRERGKRYEAAKKANPANESNSQRLRRLAAEIDGVRK